ncbi:MAG: imidazole glycerol phosphate synthase subunit HisH [Lachnospiraceae bacterium]|nr:imidazole glycerol phosphate synthase subunit HisH [Lachnospiraceae bacterium]
MIALIDYDAGNTKSALKAIEAIGKEAVLTRDPKVILAADHVILPGVGAFGDAMGNLCKYHMDEVIHEVIDKKTPFLGICVGLQLLFEDSEETKGVKGLGILPGHILKIPASGDMKIPHMGWNSLHLPRESRLFQGIPEETYVYFVHSYYLHADCEDMVTATTEYGTHIHAAVEKDNVFAVQFHPEKSSDMGLKILSNFVSL